MAPLTGKPDPARRKKRIDPAVPVGSLKAPPRPRPAQQACRDTEAEERRRRRLDGHRMKTGQVRGRGNTFARCLTDLGLLERRSPPLAAPSGSERGTGRRRWSPATTRGSGEGHDSDQGRGRVKPEWESGARLLVGGRATGTPLGPSADRFESRSLAFPSQELFDGTVDAEDGECGTGGERNP